MWNNRHFFTCLLCFVISFPAFANIQWTGKVEQGGLIIAKVAPKSTVTLNEGVVELSLDLRGKYTHEIGDTLEKFIQNSIDNGLTEVSIIHGKGSGKLREEVKKQLKRNTDVKSFRIGNWNEGDSGVTILEL